MLRLLLIIALILLSAWWQQPPTIAAGEYTVEGRISSLLLKHNRRQSFDVITEKPFHAKIHLSSKQSSARYHTGEYRRFHVSLRPPHGCANAGCFNYEHYLLSRGIAATGIVMPSGHQKLISQSFNIHSLRQIIYERLHHDLRKSPMLGPIVALSIGENHDIKKSQWDVMRKTGTSHLFAISGLHVGLVAGLTYFMIAFLSRLAPNILLYFPKQVIATSGSLMISLFYSFLAGMSVSTQRALIMLVLLGLQIFFRRLLSSSVFFLIAISIVLLINPWQIYSAGFYLSFAAVGLLIYCSTSENKTFWQRWGRAQMICFIGLSPICAWFFQQISIISIVANIIAIPFVSFIIVPCCLLSMIFLLISPGLSGAILIAASWSLELLFYFLNLLSKVPLASIAWVIPHWWQFLFAVLASIILLSQQLRSWRYLGLILFIPAVFTYQSHPSFGSVWLTVLDVDQGLATVVQTKNHTLVFDTGAKFSNTDMGQSVIIPWLQHQGIKKVDTLVISHGDNDHIGGADSLLHALPTREIYTSVPNKLPRAKYCIAGQHWQWDGVKFEMLGPLKYQQRKINDISCVLKVTGRYGSALLTGDIEEPAERALFHRYHTRLKSTAIVVPHHGSKTSSSENFLNVVKPKYALFSYGFLNRYHHPSSDVVQRYEDLGAKILDTVNSGAITLKLAQKTEIETFRR